MTALFNAPSCIIGLLFGTLFGAIMVEKGVNMKHLKENTAHLNQVIAACEADLPRSQSCELTAKVKK